MQMEVCMMDIGKIITSTKKQLKLKFFFYTILNEIY